VAAQRFSIAVAQDNLCGLLWTTIRHERVVTGRIVESRRKPKKKRLSVLIFMDGHQVEVQNYAVVGDMLYELTPGHHRKIAIADLDLKATAKQNDDLGISFQLPAVPDNK
jgi:hypothetical protein